MSTTELPATDIRQALADDLQRMGMWPEVDDETESEAACCTHCGAPHECLHGYLGDDDGNPFPLGPDSGRCWLCRDAHDCAASRSDREH